MFQNYKLNIVRISRRELALYEMNVTPSLATEATTYNVATFLD